MRKRPADANQRAKLIVDISVGEVIDEEPAVEPEGRARGGHARAEALPPERRKAIAKRAAAARWSRTEGSTRT